MSVIALSSELDTKMGNVFGLIHEICHKRRDSADNFNVRSRTPEKIGKEASACNEIILFGKELNKIIPKLKSPSFYSYVENLNNWKAKFIQNYLVRFKGIVKNELKEIFALGGGFSKRICGKKKNGCNFAAIIDNYSLLVSKKLGFEEDG